MRKWLTWFFPSQNKAVGWAVRRSSTLYLSIVSFGVMCCCDQSIRSLLSFKMVSCKVWSGITHEPVDSLEQVSIPQWDLRGTENLWSAQTWSEYHLWGIIRMSSVNIRPLKVQELKLVDTSNFPRTKYYKNYFLGQFCHFMQTVKIRMATENWVYQQGDILLSA